MKQKTINQNKLQTILCAVALTIGVLVSAVLFSMPPVYAAEMWTLKNNSGIYDFTGTYTDQWNNECSNDYHLILNSDCFYGFVDLGESFYNSDPDIKGRSYKLYYYNSYSNNVAEYTDSNKYSPFFPECTYDYANYQQTRDNFFNSDGEEIHNISFGTAPFTVSTLITTGYGNKHVIQAFSLPLPVFDSEDSMLNYCLTGDKSGLISEPEVPDTTDESYTYTGFSINCKTAKWTGTTERSYLKDQEVEEYTTITYAWASTTEPDNIGSFQTYDGEFPTSAKSLKLPWSDMESGKVDFQFIRQVNIIPCYRVSGLAFYHGQAVKIFFNSDGTVDRIEQVTIPSDSETIGNDISLIGFRYDSSFHAEWVDVWSNGANKSAFDLSGSQYLSLGIRAIYYDGSKIDIDFFTLDRKDLTWDKTFSDFKENNGSPIKSLYFTPYAKTGVNNPWNKGNSTVVSFDENGNPSSSFNTGDDGTVHLDDFKLTGVVWNKPVVQSGTITWTGTTPNSDLLFIPDSDTLVVATYPRYDSDMNASYETWSTTTIGKGSMKVNVDYLIDYYKNSELAWNGEMWLTPCYKKGGVLYMGEPVIINCLKGTVSDIVVDGDSGKAEQVDKTDQNKSDADSILNVGNQFYSIINGLIGSLQQLPALLTAIFGFLPSSIINLLYASFAVIIICRILGR